MFSTPKVTQSGTALHVEHGNDSNLYVEFTMEAIHQTFESEKQGRPIYKDVPHVRIIFPGDKTKIVFRPVNDDDKQRFLRQWQAFEREEEQVTIGTPITEWTPLSKSEAREMKAMSIHTVEALAALPDSALNWLGARSWRDKAIRWLAASKDTAVITQMASELGKRDADIASLKEQIAALAKRGPGRPSKDNSQQSLQTEE